MPLNNLGHVACAPASLWRCAQPDSEGFESLRRLGVSVIVKLNDSGEYPDGLERSNFVGKIIYDPYPRLFFVPPKEKLIRTVEQIVEMQKRGLGVCVHCTHGVDRTGLVIGAYRILCQGWTLERVQEERRLFGVNWIRDIPDYQIVQLLKDIADDGKKVGM